MTHSAIRLFATVFTAGLFSFNSNAGLSLAELGEQQFIRCSSCHSLTAGDNSPLGPHLHGIVGRQAASVDGYSYSGLLAGKDFIWTEALLEQWLEQPQQIVPDICLPFIGIANPVMREALIEYLKEAAL